MKKRLFPFFMIILLLLASFPSVSAAAQDVQFQADGSAQESQLQTDEAAAEEETFVDWAEELDKVVSDEDAEEVSNEDVYYADFADDSRLTGIKKINVPFIVFKHHPCDYDFPYTDDFFRYSSDTFSKTLAQASMGLTVSAFRNEKEDIDDQFTTYLSAAGFSDIYTFGYDKPTSPETISGLIAHKKIDDFTLIACAPCGQGYQKEWGGNLIVGDRVRHAGFKIAAEKLKTQIASYREKYGISGKVKIWLSGFSRASAAANLAAADLYKSGEYDEVYAYLFGVPKTTKTPKPFQGIYNICGQYDPVPNVPLQSWFYDRYGITLYTPAQESSSNYAALAKKASVVHKEITGKPFRNNPEINHQIHLLIDSMSEIFPTTSEYVDNMQDTLVKLWTEPNPDQIFTILSAAMKELEKADKRYENSAEVFLNYVSFIASEHLSGNKRQIEEGSWDPDADMAENFIREHSPATYMSWIFSDSPVEDVFLYTATCRMIMLHGAVDIDLYDGDILLSSVAKSGEIFSAEESQSGDKIYPDIAEMRLGNITILYLPADRSYRIEIHTDSEQTLYISDTLVFAGWQHEIGNYIFLARITKGDYELVYDDIINPGEFSSISGNILANVTEDYSDSPTLINMSEESITTDHITFTSLIGGIVALLTLMGGIGIICLIVAIIHHRKKKKGHPPYSPWWVIIPHLILIVIFALITQFVSDQMILIKTMSSGFSTITMLFIFLLSLQAFVRKKGKRNLTIMIITLLLGVASWLFFKDSPFIGQTFYGPILYYVLIAALTIIALLGFFKKTKVNVVSRTE